MTEQLAQSPTNRRVYLFAAFFLVLHIVILFSGLSVLPVLAGAFQFPDVLRLPALERLALFPDHQNLIVPAYWALTLSGFSQVFAATFLALALRPYAGAFVTLGLIFGTIAGLALVLGFGRWAVLMPYLADQMADPNISDGARDMIGLIEGSFKGYAGMLVGEHLSYIAMGIWLLFAGLGIRRSDILDARLGTLAIISSPVLFLLAAEQLGYTSGLLTLITDLGMPLLAIIHFGLAWQLARRKDLAPAPELGIGFMVVAVVAYAAMAVPVFVG